MGNTVLGVLIMLVSTSMMNVGSVVQKKAVDALPPFEGQTLLRNIRNVLAKPLWIVGWLMTTTAMVLNMVALGFADISVVQPLNGFGLVVLALTSWLYLGERLTKLTLVGIAAVIAGVALIGATVPESREFEGAAGLLASYTHPAAFVALAGFVAVILVLWFAAWRLPRVAGVLFALVAACCSVTGLTFSKGLFGLFALVGLGPSLSLWPSYALLVALLLFSTAALMIQTVSFQKGRAVVVTPVFAGSSVVLPLIMGRFVFSESVGGATLLAASCIVTGVVFLGMRVREEPVAPGGQEGER